MKTIIKNFLFKKRFKILKSKKGFSLIEVLVAVAIIGIISAIAVPTFTANRNEAARVAGDTSISNIIKAFDNCRVLNDFASCNTLALLKVNCPSCKSEEDTTGNNKFCAHISKGKDPAKPEFSACVSIEEKSTGNTTTRTYGGSLLGKKCVVTRAGCTSSAENKKVDVTPAKACITDTECANLTGAACSAGTTTWSGQKCETVSAPYTAGKCNSTADCTS